MRFTSAEHEALTRSTEAIQRRTAVVEEEATAS